MPLAELIEMVASHQNPPRNGEGDQPKAGGGVPRILQSPIKAVKRARKLRKEMSLPEVLLWQQLCQRPGGFKFRKQCPQHPFVLDFACLEARLAIEIDGEAHDRGDRPVRDAARDAHLRAIGFTTLRIPAREVLGNMEGVLTGIVEQCRTLAPSTTGLWPAVPSPFRGGIAMTNTLFAARRSLALAFLAFAIAAAAPTVAQPAGDADQAAVLVPVNAVFAAFEAGDAAAMLRQVYPDGRVTASGPRADGAANLRQLSWGQFAGRIRPDDRFQERISDPMIRIDGDIALVWAPFVVRVAGRVSNCGVDHFDLVRENGAWKVMNLTFSSRTTNCPVQ